MYEDIINLPHHVSTKRPQMSMLDRAAQFSPFAALTGYDAEMSMLDRAAQFSPFAALTGYDAAIKETGRLTDEKIEMDEASLNMLNMKFQLLVEALGDEHEVSFTYFKPDETKAGGAYVTATGIVKKVDDYERLITMVDGAKIPMDDVYSIESEIFKAID